MPLTSVGSRLLPFVDAWFDVLASLVGAQRSIAYALLSVDEPTGRHALGHPAPHAVPEGWRDMSPGA